MQASPPPAGELFALTLYVELTGGSPVSSDSCALQTCSSHLSSFFESFERGPPAVKAVCEDFSLYPKADDISQDGTRKACNAVYSDSWSALSCGPALEFALKGALRGGV